MRDPFYGHRDWLTGEESGDKDVWIDWDYALVTALQIIEDNTNKHGLLHWEIENERMDVKAVQKIDKFQAAVDRRTKGTKKNGYTPSPGEYFVPELDLRGGEWPTYSEYLQEVIAKDSDGTIE